MSPMIGDIPPLTMAEVIMAHEETMKAARFTEAIEKLAEKIEKLTEVPKEFKKIDPPL